MPGVEIAYPDNRSDILNALDLLASEPPSLTGDEIDLRWPDLTNAVHWLVDDTRGDQTDLASGTQLGGRGSLNPSRMGATS